MELRRREAQDIDAKRRVWGRCGDGMPERQRSRPWGAGDGRRATGIANVGAGGCGYGASRDGAGKNPRQRRRLDGLLAALLLFVGRGCGPLAASTAR